MKVSELAEDLEIPASAVLEQCQRFGIDASWVGAELSGADVVILRAELATSSEPLDLTPADPVAPTPEAGPSGAADAGADPADEPELVAVGAPGGADALPPTAVGSMPELIDEVTPEAEVATDPVAAPAPVATVGSGTHGVRAPGEEIKAADQVPRRSTVNDGKVRFDRSARNSIIAIVAAIVLFIAANVFTSPWAIAGLWLLCAVALLIALITSNRGRRHVSTHPERVKGMAPSIVVLVLSVAGIIGLAATINTVISDEAPDDAPLGIGDLPAMDDARWGYLRLTDIANNGWHEPAKEVGTCWFDDPAEKDARSEDRVEMGDTNRACGQRHTVEVIKVFAVNRDADGPYPGIDALQDLARERCDALAAKVLVDEDGNAIEGSMVAEYPLEAGWDDGDHDVACVVVTPERQGSLTD